MIAFFCATPYQILVALQIKISFFPDTEADLFILNHFTDSGKTASNVKKQNVFRNVTEVQSLAFTKSVSGKSKKRHFLKILSYYNYKKIAKKYFRIDEQKYKHVFFSYADVIIQIALKKILLNNTNAKIHLFEDGVGGYLKFGTNISVKKKIFNWATCSQGLENYHDLYAFLPELMYETKLPVIKIPKINSENNIFVNLLNATFNYTKSEDDINEEIIILEQPLNFEEGLDEIQYKILKEALPFDHVIKLHPRSQSSKYAEFNKIANSKVPWEIFCLNMQIESKVLVSFFSTAAISNKFLFDQEPTIIFLYDIDVFKENFKISDELHVFFTNFQNYCRTSDKIYFPKSIAEFRQVLHSLDKSVNV